MTALGLDYQTITMYDLDFPQGLQFVENDFLNALEKGATTLSSYHQAWSALPDALSAATRAGHVGGDTLILVNFVSSRMSDLANCFLGIKREEMRFTSQLQSDCDAMFRRMETLDLDAQSRSSPLIDAKTSAFNVENVSLNFIPAFQWLLDNLHNPYPTAKVKARIAAASCCEVSAISSWFINTRRRIGWTTLCRERFSNCRADMIDAADRALVEEDPQRTLSPELRHSFVAMRVAAENLYSSMLTRDTFPGDLVATVKDMTKKNGEFAKSRVCHQTGRVDLMKAVQDSYPSPGSSFTSSPVPTPSDSFAGDSKEDDGVASLVVAGFKRRRSMEKVDQQSSIASRPIKRLRASLTSQMCLPSMPSSKDGVNELPHRSSPELPRAQSTLPETNEASPLGNLCLSDADATGISKCPDDLMIVPRLQSTSNPSPRSNVENEPSIDDWFNANFNALFTIPPPVDAIEPDFSGWEVELFKDYNIPENLEYQVKCLAAPTTPAYLPAPSDLSDLDELLQSIGGDAFVTPANCLPQCAVTGTSCTTSLNSPTFDISHTSINCISLLNGTEVYHPNTYCTSPKYPSNSQLLPEINLSMLQLPQNISVPDSQADSLSKQAKLQQLHAMQEAVWRIEQELRSEGVVI